MRILAFDHFYTQDLDALQKVLGESDSLFRLPYRRWHNVARRCFASGAFDGLSRAYDHDMEPAWKKFGLFVERETEWLIAVRRPELLLLPSDAFFYVRPFIESFARRGVKTFVMQKETTISPLVMEKHSEQVGKYVPFMSDFMTVCSERHREFWLRAGTDPSKIAVTGQPRFDVYAEKSGMPPGEKKRLLYLSFDDKAYLPSDIGLDHDGDWSQMRLEIEKVVSEFSERYDVVVKKHPQQSRSPSNLGSDIREADRAADTRRLILDADVVVAFQTTAIYEAIACGKPVIYAAWGKTYESVKSTLIQFEKVSGMVRHACDSLRLQQLLDDDSLFNEATSAPAMEEIRLHLGPIDGMASRRALEHMTSFVTKPIPQNVRTREFLRRSLSVFPFAIFGLVSLVMATFSKDLARRLRGRARDARSNFHEVLAALGGGG